jgi:hypothetical protein
MEVAQVPVEKIEHLDFAKARAQGYPAAIY